jgi:hypothetical protein
MEEVWKQLARHLDTQDADVTPWEAEFLESLLRRDRAPSPKQLAVLTRMVERYLGPEQAAELHGQQRLWPD